ncbi:carboxymuconolactone decarboxylase family protein [Algoriphagus sp.]|uniref:carboxymuconolactone decarboxylase family protein n=1 Tax=Algoriphagus sp. TaxID=1872435 RepID=UPI002625D95F|nr:carboxymuconolactone decarboxylase family protein [Algoriphagus sp.]
MDKRINIQGLEPDAYQAMIGLEKLLKASPIPLKLKSLIKIRASQINGCAYCIKMHTSEALKQGESQLRIFTLSAWRESSLYSPLERVVLQMTEEITLIAKQGLTEKTYQEAKEAFSDREIAQLILEIAVINSWNRIAVSTNMGFFPSGDN